MSTISIYGWIEFLHVINEDTSKSYQGRQNAKQIKVHVHSQFLPGIHWLRGRTPILRKKTVK